MGLCSPGAHRCCCPRCRCCPCRPGCLCCCSRCCLHLCRRPRGRCCSCPYCQLRPRHLCRCPRCLHWIQLRICPRGLSPGCRRPRCFRLSWQNLRHHATHKTTTYIQRRYLRLAVLNCDKGFHRD